MSGIRGARRRTLSAAALLSAILLFSACGGNQASPTPAGVVDPGTADELCPEVQLRAPSGDRVRLTGTWFADDFGDYFITQRASCLHWLGMNAAREDVPAGEWWTNVYVGQIASDFSVHGEWADVPYRSFYSEGEQPNSGEIVLNIDFFADDLGTEFPALHMVEVRDNAGGYGGANWIPTTAMPPRSEYVGTYRFEDGCPSIELSGQRYELVQNFLEIAAQGQILGDGFVVARPGDQLRVEGQIWPDPGAVFSCKPNRMLVWNLQTAAP